MMIIIETFLTFIYLLLFFYVCTYRTWSTGRSVTDGWPDTTPEQENKDWVNSQQAAASYTDLVPEFEPGKPWKVLINKKYIFFFLNFLFNSYLIPFVKKKKQ